MDMIAKLREELDHALIELRAARKERDDAREALRLVVDHSKCEVWLAPKSCATQHSDDLCPICNARRALGEE